MHGLPIAWSHSKQGSQKEVSEQVFGLGLFCEQGQEELSAAGTLTEALRGQRGALLTKAVRSRWGSW